MDVINRREFLRGSAGAVFAGSLMAAGLGRATAAGGVNGTSPPLKKFIQPLRLPGAGIPLAVPDTGTYPGVDYYRIAAGQFSDQLHPALAPTRLWGYYDLSNPVQRHLGGLIVAKSGTPVRISFTNNLPSAHLLPVDTSLPGAEPGQPDSRAAIHLHGGFVSWPSDGGPHHWIASDLTAGESHVAWLPDGAGVTTDDLWYPNAQSARLMWYHDHAMGNTRLNAYAGLATGYVLTDAYEAELVAGGAIPGQVPGTDIPLVFQDKIFKQFPDAWGVPGDLWYPSAYPKNIRGLPNPSVVPEFFGDTMLCNGTVYPYLQVEPRRYRFRILNACQSAFFNLQLYYAKSVNGGAEANPSRPGPPFVQIGTEGGFLPEPVLLNHRKIGFSVPAGLPNRYTLLLGPAERADIVIDFTSVPVGSKLILYTDAPGPFPGGAPPIAPAVAGYGPDTMNLLQFQVVAKGSLTGRTDDPGYGTPIILPPVASLATVGVAPKGKTLNESVDAFGRLIQMVGTTDPVAPGVYARAYTDPATETAAAGETQVWDIYNLTMDSHPMHFHLVNVQILGRAPFDARRPVFAPAGPWIPPDANERGWKETVKMHPGQVTRVAMRFDLPPVPSQVTNAAGESYPVVLPVSPRTGGHEYVWHCHILEHEEHDMMRPLVVT